MWYCFLKRYNAWNKTPSPVVSHNKEGKNDEVRQEDDRLDWCCGHALLAACGSTSAGDGGSTGSSDKKIELTVWSWDSTLPRTVKGFEAKNPNIKVKVTNAGTNKDEYNALSNAIEAGSGARTSPDRIRTARIRDSRPPSRTFPISVPPISRTSTPRARGPR